MSELKILITGADGMVGREIAKSLDFISLPHAECDITDEAQVAIAMKKYAPDLVVHLAALTNVFDGDKSPDEFYKVNVIGTRNVARYAKNIMYWSTEYVFDGTKGNYSEHDTPRPINYYGLTKLLGEAEARNVEGKSVVIRTALKPRPYKHPQVPKDCYTTGHYVDEMAKEFVLAIKNFDKLPNTLNIGLSRISLVDLAKETNPDIKEVELSSLPIAIPRDASLNVSTWNRIKSRL